MVFDWEVTAPVGADEDYIICRFDNCDKGIKETR